MPVPGPPPGGGIPVQWSSDGSFGALQGTLADVASNLDNAGKRLDAIKRLRIVRGRLHTAFTPNQITLLSPGSYKHYGDPRLSTVAAAIGCGTVENNPVHLDVDWFGPPALNWWAGPIDGAWWHEAVVSRLLCALEDSLGIPRSDPEPSSWQWGNFLKASSPNWHTNFTKATAGPRKAPMPFVIEWEQEPFQPVWEVAIANGGNRIRIRTGSNIHNGS